MKVSMGFLVHAGLSQLLLLATMNDTHGFGISARAMAFSIQRAGHTSPSDVSLQTKPMIRLQANNHNYSHDNENDEKQVASNFATSKVSTTSSSLPIKWFSQVVVATTLLLGSTFCNYGLPPMMMENNNIVVIPPAHAYASEGGSKIVGTLQGSGIFFKDSLQIERFEDPKVKGVVLYISNFDRPFTEKLNKSFFSDPSYASVACAKTGKDIAIADNIAKGPQGEEVFEESRSLLFKTLRVQRIYDTDTNTVVYVSFNTRFDKSDDTNKSRFKSSLCAVNLNDQ